MKIIRNTPNIPQNHIDDIMLKRDFNQQQNNNYLDLLKQYNNGFKDNCWCSIICYDCLLIIMTPFLLLTTAYEVQFFKIVKGFYIRLITLIWYALTNFIIFYF
jgi:hypothetical protein